MASPTDEIAPQLAALAAYLAGRQEAILESWRNASRAEPGRHTADQLTRSQFNDHIPAFLTAFQRKLRSQPGSAKAEAANDAIDREEVMHGLQRWQQGYTLLELMAEWGQLHMVLFDELERFADQAPPMSQPARSLAHRELSLLINAGITESANQYARLQRAEADGMVQDLENSLKELRSLDNRRTELIRQAVHDLRGNVQSMGSAAEVLRAEQIAERDRIEFASLLQQGVDTVSVMLGDLLELARLEAGHERRQVAPFDGAHVVADLCRRMEPIAVERGLYLQKSGTIPLPVEGDAPKVRRMLQNLVLNALKYTKQGGVTVTWGDEKELWWVKIKDTGPGLMGGPAAPLATKLKDATVAAHEADVQAPPSEATHVLDQAAAGSGVSAQGRQSAGEGIGLSIVKRLSELLAASMELTSSATDGTTIRIVFPKRY